MLDHKNGKYGVEDAEIEGQAAVVVKRCERYCGMPCMIGGQKRTRVINTGVACRQLSEVIEKSRRTAAKWENARCLQKPRSNVAIYRISSPRFGGVVDVSLVLRVCPTKTRPSGRQAAAVRVRSPGR